MRLKTLVALPFVVFSLSVPADAAPPPVPRGPEIRVNTNRQVSHFNPSVAVFPDGGFVVVWMSGSGVRARFFDPQGRPTSGERGLRAGGVDQVVADRDGSFLVVWTGAAVSRPSSNVYVRRFHRDGTPQGKVIRANTPNASDRYDAVIALGPNGRFAVAWKAEVPVSEEEGYTNAVARIFTAQGIPVTPEITLHTGSPAGPAGDDGSEAFPASLALAPDGTLSALVQHLEAAGCLHSYLVQVPPDGGSHRLQGLGSVLCAPEDYLGASLALGRDGSLIAAWSDYDIQAQRFAPDGTPRGEWFWVSQEAADARAQAEAGVALQAGGSFVVVWTEVDGRDGDGDGIFGRAFAVDGTPRTRDFRINVTTAGDQHDPAIAAARRGPVIVVWTQQLDDSGRSDVVARVLSANR